MIIKIDGNADVDTERDLTAAERHILQKLFGWRDLVNSVKDFRTKVDQCLKTGWNSSGPIKPGSALQRVILQMENELYKRAQKRK